MINTIPENIPSELRSVPQWVNWRLSPSGARGDRIGKVPVSAKTMLAARVNDPETWSSFDHCLDRLRSDPKSLDGMGFVFTESDDFVGIDLDGCVVEQRRLSGFAQEVLSRLDSYTEYSPSGTGVKCFLRAPGFNRNKRKVCPAIEIYSSHRYFTVTGHKVSSHTTIEQRTNEIELLTSKEFAAQKIVALTPDIVMNEIPDEQILVKARNAKNSSKFITLWNDGAVKGNQSDDDLSFLRILAFWCGPNPSQIDRLFRQSKRFRSKWDRRIRSSGKTYGQQSIEKAIADQTAFYAW